MRDAALDLPTALAQYRRFVGMTPALPPRLWTDTDLAAFAIAAGLRLLTFDADFARFAALQQLRLKRH